MRRKTVLSALSEARAKQLLEEETTDKDIRKTQIRRMMATNPISIINAKEMLLANLFAVRDQSMISKRLSEYSSGIAVILTTDIEVDGFKIKGLPKSVANQLGLEISENLFDLMQQIVNYTLDEKLEKKGVKMQTNKTRREIDGIQKDYKDSK